MEGKAETVARPCPSSCFPTNQLRPETGPPARIQGAAAPLRLPRPMQAATSAFCGRRGRSLACACSWRAWQALRRRPRPPLERRSASRPEDRPGVRNVVFVVARERIVTPACGRSVSFGTGEGNDSWLSKKRGYVGSPTAARFSCVCFMASTL